MYERCYICGQEIPPESRGGSCCAGCNRPVCAEHTVIYTGQVEFEGETRPTITQMCSACADNYDETISNVVFTRGLFGISLGRHKDSAAVKLAAKLDAMNAAREMEKAQVEPGGLDSDPYFGDLAGADAQEVDR